MNITFKITTNLETLSGAVKGCLRANILVLQDKDDVCLDTKSDIVDLNTIGLQLVEQLEKRK